MTAERRAADQADMLRSRGASVITAPTVHTVDLADDPQLRPVTEDVIAQPPDITVATTGYGMSLWAEAAESWGLRDDLVAALATSTVIARGPKSRTACRHLGLEVAWTAPGESMAEVVDHVRTRSGVASAHVVVQVFDPDETEFSQRLQRSAASLRQVPLYRWVLPRDPEPASRLVDAVIAGDVDAVTFTSQPAVTLMLRIAGDRAADLVAAFNDGRSLPVCVGPVCADAATAAGITTSRWPEPFRLVPMIRLVEKILGAPHP